MSEIVLNAFANFLITIDRVGMVPFFMTLTVGFGRAEPIMALSGLTGVHLLTCVLGVVLAAPAVKNIVEGLRTSFPGWGG